MQGAYDSKNLERNLDRIGALMQSHESRRRNACCRSNSTLRQCSMSCIKDDALCCPAPPQGPCGEKRKRPTADEKELLESLHTAGQLHNRVSREAAAARISTGVNKTSEAQVGNRAKNYCRRTKK